MALSRASENTGIEQVRAAGTESQASQLASAAVPASAGKRTAARVMLACLAALVCGAPLFVAYQFDGQQAFSYLVALPENAALCYAIFCVLAVGAGAATFALLGYRPRKHRKERSRLALIPLSFNRKSILVCTAILLVCWCPIIVSMFPCGIYGDTVNQLYQYEAPAPTYYTTMHMYLPGEFISHHPVFDSLLYGAFFSLGDALGSQNVGMFSLVVIQSVVLALELALMCCYLERLNVSRNFRLLALVFFALFPLFPRNASTIYKDVTFLTVWIPFFLLYVECFRTRGESIRKLGPLIALICFGGLCMLTKSLGAYVVLPSMLVMALALKKTRKQSLAAFAATFVCFSLLVPACISAAVGGVSPGGKQEVLGFTFQQVTLAARENPDSITEEEYRAINRVFDLEESKRRYRPDLVDPVKSTFHIQTVTDKDISDFLLTWMAIGLRNPSQYAAATFGVCSSLIVPIHAANYISYPPDANRETHQLVVIQHLKMRDPGFSYGLSRPESLRELSDLLDGIYQSACHIPLISLVTCDGFYDLWLPFICLVILLFNRKNNPRWAFVIFPLLLSLFYLILSPASLTRYALPLIATAPLVIGLARFSYEPHADSASSPSFLQKEQQPSLSKGLRKDKSGGEG